MFGPAAIRHDPDLAARCKRQDEINREIARDRVRYPRGRQPVREVVFLGFVDPQHRIVVRNSKP